MALDTYSLKTILTILLGIWKSSNSFDGMYEKKTRKASLQREGWTIKAVLSPAMAATWLET